MKIDKQIFQIFQAQPQWVFLLAGHPSPGEYRFESITIKAIETRCDGVLVPSHKGKEEIEEMLVGQLPDLRDTQSGKDLIAIGKAEGRAETKVEWLLKLLEIRFGDVPATLREGIQKIDSDERINALYELGLKVSKLSEFKL